MRLIVLALNLAITIKMIVQSNSVRYQCTDERQRDAIEEHAFTEFTCGGIMKRPETLIFVGFIIVALGIIFFTISNADSGTTFFFVFPFFIFGDSGPIAIAAVLIVVVTISVFFLFPICKSSRDPLLYEGHPYSSGYFQMASKCSNCNSPVPDNASFCPSCGISQGAPHEDEKDFL
ncbi:MAG: zinc ribbon domain-containing protein [Candidatus Thorarchaeota archaeon]